MYEQEKINPYRQGEKGAQVEEMFDNIAPTYDTLNHRLSWNIDKYWRRKAIDKLRPYRPKRILDVATGTGDFAIEAARALQPKELLGTDISEGMMQVGRDKVAAMGLDSVIRFQREDCLALSLADDSFDLCVIELTTPVAFPMRQLFSIYSHTVLPLYGRLISKDTKAYSYLTQTIEAFPQGEAMEQILRRAGFAEASFQRLTFGICTLYFATK